MTKSELTVQALKNMAEQWGENMQAQLVRWDGPCDCIPPGYKPKCQDCPFLRAFVLRLQQRIATEKEGKIPTWLVPRRQPPYSSEDRRVFLVLYKQGFSLDELKIITGISQRKIIRKWLEEVGLLPQANDYSEEQKHECMELFEAGLSAHEIEHRTGVLLEAVNAWIREAGLTMRRRSYTQEQRDRCKDLYLKGTPVDEIEEKTGVKANTISRWMNEMKVKRPDHLKNNHRKSGRPPTYSKEFRAQCMTMLDAGKTVIDVQIEMGPTADTIRRWRKEAKKLEQSATDSLQECDRQPQLREEQPVKQPNAREGTEAAPGAPESVPTTNEPEVRQLRLGDF